MQEEAFYVMDVGNIISKHDQWQRKLPRVEPHYGNELIFVYLVFCIFIYVLFYFSCQVQRQPNGA